MKSKRQVTIRARGRGGMEVGGHGMCGCAPRDSFFTLRDGRQFHFTRYPILYTTHPELEPWRIAEERFLLDGLTPEAKVELRRKIEEDFSRQMKKPQEFIRIHERECPAPKLRLRPGDMARVSARWALYRIEAKAKVSQGGPDFLHWLKDRYPELVEAVASDGPGRAKPGRPPKWTEDNPTAQWVRKHKADNPKASYPKIAIDSKAEHKKNSKVEGVSKRQVRTILAPPKKKT
jgi:hypothetical protein